MNAEHLRRANEDMEASVAQPRPKASTVRWARRADVDGGVIMEDTTADTVETETESGASGYSPPVPVQATWAQTTHGQYTKSPVKSPIRGVPLPAKWAASPPGAAFKAKPYSGTQSTGETDTAARAKRWPVMGPPQHPPKKTTLRLSA